MILNALETALSRIDWDFATPSRIDYSGVEPHEIAAQKWQERVFAYVLYHQLRVLWNGNRELRDHCIIHTEVRKHYQKIAGFDYMPDFLFHLPQPGQNYAVAEVKLASRGDRDIRADLKKLVRFRTELGYNDLIEILVGNHSDLQRIRETLRGGAGIPIHLFCLSNVSEPPTHEIIHYQNA